MNKLLIVVITTLFVVNGFSQNGHAVKANVKSTKLTFLGKSKSIVELKKQEATSEHKISRDKQASQRPNNFQFRGKSNSILPHLEHQGPDALRQKDQGLKRSNEPLVNIDGLGTGSPLDPSGDIGRDVYVQMVNATEVGVFSKEGNLINSFFANTLWEELGASSEGDPIVLYDEEFNRWILTEFTGPANVLIAVSDTEDPLGSYNAYTFSTPDFPDYPKYAIWPNAYVITTNEGGPNDLHQYVLDRKAMLAGSDNVTMQRIELPGSNNTEAGFFVSTPVDWNGTLFPSDTTPIVVVLNDSSWGEVAQDQIELYRIVIDWKNVDNTQVIKTSIVTSPFDSYPCADTGFGFSCIPQKDGTGLDGIPELIMNIPHYRRFANHESIVLSFITDATNGENISGIRWVELRKTEGKDWSLYQEGTYAPEDGLNRFMPSIAMNDKGDIGLAYNVSSKDSYAGIRFTGRTEVDGLGEMSVEEIEAVTGQSAITSFGRFGDYAQMSVDPQNKETFWYTSEYAGDDQATRSRILAFEIGLDSIDLAVKDILNPSTNSTLTNAEKVSTILLNRGLITLKDFQVGLLVDGLEVERKTITDSLKQGETLEVTFDHTIDFSEYLKEVNITVFAEETQDKNVGNNTKSKKIKKIYRRDASISSNAEFNRSFCSGQVSFDITVRNEGEERLERLVFKFSYNGVEVEQKKPVNILTNNEQTLTFTLQNVNAGDVTITATLISINDLSDENLSQNSIELATLKMFSTTYHNRLFIKTDDFPNENSWQLVDISNDEILYQAGPLSDDNTILSQDICIDPEGCYKFSFFDEFGDGICCNSGNGNISFKNMATNKTIFSSDGQFGDKYEKEFCISDFCVLNTQYNLTDDNGSGNGSITINASNGKSPYLYSIDGGVSFFTDNLFDSLSFGMYHVVVKDATGICNVTDSVEVKFFNAVDENITVEKFNIAPNPNDGYFSIELATLESKEYQVQYQILDSSGRLIQKRKMNKYSDAYVSTVSMLTEPSGTYFIKVIGTNWEVVRSFIKK